MENNGYLEESGPIDEKTFDQLIEKRKIKQTQVTKEVQAIENDFREKLQNYVNVNKDISISMSLNTQKTYTDLKNGKSILNKIDIIIETDIKLGL
ncbi:hypothetical protein SAMN05421866_0053 [Chryseobacterium oranimense]|uniref:Uncharacterized protein n=1 Tax=Chryseobacterium oranimense TaxID=421058 RepID=A0A1M5X8C7_9FLAO|nr:hypothetical protein [Chryseobacterium oranimense]SHH96087.1 hypothetical protein SAMN05421866_0053 [Chryseobacterium oranimense]